MVVERLAPHAHGQPVLRVLLPRDPRRPGAARRARVEDRAAEQELERHLAVVERGEVARREHLEVVAARHVQLDLGAAGERRHRRRSCRVHSSVRSVVPQSLTWPNSSNSRVVRRRVVRAPPRRDLHLRRRAGRTGSARPPGLVHAHGERERRRGGERAARAASSTAKASSGTAPVSGRAAVIASGRREVRHPRVDRLAPGGVDARRALGGRRARRAGGRPSSRSCRALLPCLVPGVPVGRSVLDWNGPNFSFIRSPLRRCGSPGARAGRAPRRTPRSAAHTSAPPVSPRQCTRISPTSA